MPWNSATRHSMAGRLVVFSALLAGAFLFIGCASSDHPTAPDKPVVMKSGSRRGHHGAVPAAPSGQTGQ